MVTAPMLPSGGGAVIKHSYHIIWRHLYSDSLDAPFRGGGEESIFKPSYAHHIIHALTCMVL